MFPRGLSSHGVKVTTHLHLVLKLGISGAVSLLPYLSLRTQKPFHFTSQVKHTYVLKASYVWGLVSDSRSCQNVTPVTSFVLKWVQWCIRITCDVQGNTKPHKRDVSNYYCLVLWGWDRSPDKGRGWNGSLPPRPIVFHILHLIQAPSFVWILKCSPN
jgi:hypothetical protein